MEETHGRAEPSSTSFLNPPPSPSLQTRFCTSLSFQLHIFFVFLIILTISMSKRKVRSLFGASGRDMLIFSFFQTRLEDSDGDGDYVPSQDESPSPSKPPPRKVAARVSATISTRHRIHSPSSRDASTTQTLMTTYLPNHLDASQSLPRSPCCVRRTTSRADRFAGGHRLGR